MKKFISILFLILLVGNVYSQKFIVKARYAAVKTYESYGWTEWSDWTKVSLDIIVDTDNAFITIDNGFQDKFLITSSAGDEEVIEEGERVSKYYFEAVDKDGKKPSIMIKIYEDGTTQIYIYYINIKYAYQGDVHAYENKIFY